MARPIGPSKPRKARTPEEAFGKAVTQLRVEKGMTQEELAHSLGYDSSTIGQLELGKKSPTLRTVFNIAEKFDISVTSLLARTEKYWEGKKK